MVAEIIYGPCIWFIKLSLFLLLLELFGRLRWLRYMAIAGMTVTGLFYGATVVVYPVMCSPRGPAPQSQVSYIRALTSEKCRQARLLMNLVGVINVISDLYLILLPLPAVWSLNLPLRKKIGVSTIFFTGSMSDLFSLQFRIQFTDALIALALLVFLVLSIAFTYSEVRTLRGFSFPDGLPRKWPHWNLRYLLTWKLESSK